jgi:hypothetical protein
MTSGLAEACGRHECGTSEAVALRTQRYASLMGGIGLL